MVLQIFSLINRNIKKINWAVFVGFLFLSFLFRFWSFFCSVIDHDESLYILVADSWNNGLLPYVEVWDNKPPGIFVLFSLAMFVFGDSVQAIRILGCVAVAITSYLLYEIGNFIGENEKKIGLLAGIFYLVFSLNNYGIASNAEILFAPFVTLAFYLFFRATEYSGFNSFVIGLFMGCAMQIKYVVIMDFFALLLIGGIHLFLNQKKKLLKFYVFLCMGFIVPFIVTTLYFLILGYFNEYIYATWTANQKYIAISDFYFRNLLPSVIEQIYNNFILYLCLFLSPIYLKSSNIFSKKEKRNLVYLISWFCLTFIATLLSKRFIAHYYLQLLPPLCLISSCIVIKTVYRQSAKNIIKHHLILILLLSLFLVQTVYPHIQKSINFVKNRYILKQGDWGDQEAVVANYIKEKINRSQYIYIANYQVIIYYLVGAKLPTKYVFPSHLIRYYSSITGIEPIQELDRIMNKKPIYVILDIDKKINEDYAKALYGYLRKDYILEKSIESVQLYRLKNSV